jgi:hypothetical protein
MDVLPCSNILSVSVPRCTHPVYSSSYKTARTDVVVILYLYLWVLDDVTELRFKLQGTKLEMNGKHEGRRLSTVIAHTFLPCAWVRVRFGSKLPVSWVRSIRFVSGSGFVRFCFVNFY